MSRKKGILIPVVRVVVNLIVIGCVLFCILFTFFETTPKAYSYFPLLDWAYDNYFECKDELQTLKYKCRKTLIRKIRLEQQVESCQKVIQDMRYTDTEDAVKTKNYLKCMDSAHD